MTKEAFEVRIAEIVAECSVEGWDGYGARPVTPAQITAASFFFGTLPEDCPDPDISADPNGDISFDWQPARAVVLSFSIGADGRISYAGMLGPYKIAGSMAVKP